MMLSCPALLVVTLLVVALTVPLTGRDEERVARIELPGGATVSQVAFAPDGGRVYSGHKLLGPTIIGVDAGGLHRGRASGEVSSTTMAVDPTGRALLIALADGTLHVRDPETLELRRRLGGHEDRVMDLAVSGDGESLISVDCEGVVRVWGVAEGRLDREFRAPGRVACCALSPDGRRLALGGQDGGISVIDPATGVEEARWDGHGRRAITLDLGFTPDGRVLASLGLDRTLRLWDADADAGWAPIRAIALPGSPSACLAIAPDGRGLATGHRDGSVRLWDAATGELIATERVDSVQATSICFAPDGRRLAVACGSSVAVVEVARPA